MDAPPSQVKEANARFIRRLVVYWLIFASAGISEWCVVVCINPFDSTLESTVTPAFLLSYAQAIDWLQFPVAFARHAILNLGFRMQSSVVLCLILFLTGLLL